MIIFSLESSRSQRSHNADNNRKLWESHLAEAYGCQRCTVDVENLTDNAISQAKAELIKSSKTRFKSKSQELSPTTVRRDDDRNFKPPLPYPTQTEVVESIDSESK